MTKQEKKENFNFKFIKNFTKVKISTICQRLNIDKSNLLKGTSKLENYKLVKDEIINEVFMLGDKND